MSAVSSQRFCDVMLAVLPSGWLRFAFCLAECCAALPVVGMALTVILTVRLAVTSTVALRVVSTVSDIGSSRDEWQYR